MNYQIGGGTVHLSTQAVYGRRVIRVSIAIARKRGRASFGGTFHEIDKLWLINKKQVHLFERVREGEKTNVSHF